MVDYIYDNVLKVWCKENIDDFSYCDGVEVEKYIYDAVLSAKDKSSKSLELNGFVKDWPTEYHLSSVRQNLLRPFNFSKANNVLDLGTGCGAILRFWGETGLKTVGVEGSLFRAKIASARCADLKNISVYVSNLMDFEFDEKFDVISLIGVLEYSPVFIEALDPVKACLEHCKKILTVNGIVVIAIENQLGVKYFAGYPEDHLGRQYVGIEGKYTGKTPVTYGKKQLKEKILSAGFKNVSFYYPFPDYKTPTILFSEEGLDKLSSEKISEVLINSNERFNGAAYAKNFDTLSVNKTLAQNGLLADFSNSFLVFATNAECADYVDNFLYTTYSNSGEMNSRM